MTPAGFPVAPSVPGTGHPVVPAYNAAYGGFWIRFVALLIDIVVLRLVLFPARAILAGIGLSALHGHMGPSDMRHIFVLVPAMAALFVGAMWLYEALLLSSPWQATLGKKALGLKVTDEFGNRITFQRATGRYFAKWVSLFTLCIGFIMAGFTDRKRALHDMIAETLVMKEQRY